MFFEARFKAVMPSVDRRDRSKSHGRSEVADLGDAIRLQPEVTRLNNR